MRRAKEGFSLIEVMAALGITVAAVAIMYSVYLSGLDVWQTAGVQADLQAKARLTLQVMSAELKNATRTSTQNDPSPNLSIPSKPNNNSIIFYLPGDKDEDGLLTDEGDGTIEWITNNPIQYQYVPGQKLLRRLEKGVQRALAEDVTDVQFIDASIDNSLLPTELRVVLTLTQATTRNRDVTFTLTSVVRLRN